MKIIIFFIFILAVFFIGSINYFANNIAYFDRLNKTEDLNTPKDVDCNYKEEKILISNKFFCNGWYIPADKKTKKLIILVHGRQSNKKKLLQYVQFLHKAEYNVFLMDFRNSGESYYAPCSMGYYESLELVEAIKYLQQKYNNIEDIAIIGFSMGGAISVLAIDNIRSKDVAFKVKIKALILDSTYPSLTDIIQRIAENKRFYNKYYFDLVLKYYGWRLKFDIKKLDLIKVLNSMPDLPVFIIHGNVDISVPQVCGKKMFDSLNISKKEAWFPDGVEHGKAFTEYPKEYQSRVLKFLKSANF